MDYEYIPSVSETIANPVGLQWSPSKAPSLNDLAPMPPVSYGAQNGMSTWDKIFGVANSVASLGGAAANIISTTKGNAAAPVYINSGTGAIGMYKGTYGGTEVPSVVTQGLSAVDSYLANSQTLKNATSNLGASAVSKFVPWLIGGIALIGLILILKPKN